MLDVRITIIEPHENHALDKRIELHFTNVEATLESLGADKDLLKPLVEAHGDTSKIEVGTTLVSKPDPTDPKKLVIESAPDPAKAVINNVGADGQVKTSVISLLDLFKK